MNYLRSVQYQMIMLNLSKYTFYYILLYFSYCVIKKYKYIYIYIKNNIKKLNQYNHNGALLS